MNRKLIPEHAEFKVTILSGNTVVMEKTYTVNEWGTNTFVVAISAIRSALDVLYNYIIYGASNVKGFDVPLTIKLDRTA